MDSSEEAACSFVHEDSSTWVACDPVCPPHLLVRLFGSYPRWGVAYGAAAAAFASCAFVAFETSAASDVATWLVVAEATYSPSLDSTCSLQALASPGGWGEDSAVEESSDICYRNSMSFVDINPVDP